MIVSWDDRIPIYTIFIFLLIACHSFLPELFPCKVREIMRNNLYIKHFIGLLTLTFFVVLTENLYNNMFQIIYKSIVLYIMLLFIIRTQYQFFIVILVLLAILYLLILKKNEMKDKIKEEKNQEEIKKITNNINTIIFINNTIYFIIILVTIIGFLVYMGKKKYQYKQDFNYITFIFGKQGCSMKKETLNIMNSIQYSFK
jgi:hypothetical protein